MHWMSSLICPLIYNKSNKKSLTEKIRLFIIFRFCLLITVPFSHFSHESKKARNNLFRALRVLRGKKKGIVKEHIIVHCCSDPKKLKCIKKIRRFIILRFCLLISIPFSHFSHESTKARNIPFRVLRGKQSCPFRTPITMKIIIHFRSKIKGIVKEHIIVDYSSDLRKLKCINKIIVTLIILFLFNFPIVGSNSSSDQQSDSVLISSETSSDWNMFMGDLNHTGYSSSTAPDTNNLLWSFETGDEIYSSPTVANGKVFIGSRNGKIYCLDEFTGKKIWEYSTGTGVLYGVTSSAAIIDGKVIFGSCNNNIYCLPENDTNDDGVIGEDEVIWIFETEDAVYSSPAVVHEKVFIGSNDKNLYCLDVNSGNLIWNFIAEEPVYSSPVVYNGKVYFGTAPCEGASYAKIHCVDEITGKELWSYLTGESVVSSPMINNDRLYFGCLDGYVYCFDSDPIDGIDEGILDPDGVEYDIIWKFNSDLTYSSPCYADGKVYIASLNNKVYCLDSATGEQIWDYETENDIFSSPIIVDEKLYIGSIDGKFYCLNASTGSPIWNYTTIFAEYGISGSAAVADGKVFVGSCDKNIYCFGKPTSPTLSAKIYADPLNLYPCNESKITVRVLNGTVPIPGAYVSLIADSGFTNSSGFTDDNGNFSRIYSAPLTYSKPKYQIDAIASKSGFVNGTDSIEINIKPFWKFLTVSITSNPPMLNSGQRSIITVHVIEGITPVANVEIEISAEGGSFSKVNGLTDENGNFTTLYTAPKINSNQNFIINAKAKKSKYYDGTGSFEIIVEETDSTINIWLYTLFIIISSIIIIVITTLIFHYKINRINKKGGN